jgi:hypothetical protein
MEREVDNMGYARTYSLDLPQCRPFSVCNIEKLGMGLGMRLFIGGYCMAGIFAIFAIFAIVVVG